MPAAAADCRKLYERHSGTSDPSFAKAPLPVSHCIQNLLDQDVEESSSGRIEARRLVFEQCYFEKHSGTKRSKCVLPSIQLGIEQYRGADCDPVASANQV